MAEPPDNHTIVKSFLAALPPGWWKHLFCQGLSPVINYISEFVRAVKVLEIMERTAQLFEQHVEQCPTKKALVLVVTPSIRTAWRANLAPQEKRKHRGNPLLAQLRAPESS